MKILDAVWFTPIPPAWLQAVAMSGVSLTIGVVLGQDEVTGQKKAYIGYGRGRDEGEDSGFIASHGSPIPLEAVGVLFGTMEGRGEEGLKGEV